MTKYGALMKKAKELEKMLNTEYAEEHAELWERFDSEINAAYESGEITEKQFNKLVCTAFYDYNDLKEETEE